MSLCKNFTAENPKLVISRDKGGGERNGWFLTEREADVEAHVVDCGEILLVVDIEDAVRVHGHA